MTLGQPGGLLFYVGQRAEAEVWDLLAEAVADVGRGYAALVTAWVNGQLAGLGYWRRYARHIHRPHADVEKVGAVRSVSGSRVDADTGRQRGGIVGRQCAGHADQLHHAGVGDLVAGVPPVTAGRDEAAVGQTGQV